MKKLSLRILLASLTTLMIIGCTNQPKLKSNPNLPTVSEVDYRKDRNQVVIYWNKVDDPIIKGYYITRDEGDKKSKLIATINDTDVTYYNDRDLTPKTKYIYKIATFDINGVPSKGIQLEAFTRENIEPVVGIRNENLKKQGKVKLSFRFHDNERVSGYLIQRYNGEKFETIAKLKSRFNVEFLDKNLKDGKLYQYRVIAVSYDGLESDPSEVLSVKTLEKPSVVMGLKASSDIPKKINLNWNKVNNIKYYEVYSSNELNGFYKLIAKTKNNFFVDILEKDGYIKYYKVISVDKYDIKSIMQDNGVMGSTISIPKKPEVSKDAYSLKFLISSPDKRAVKYEVERVGDNLVKKFINVSSNFEDKTIENNSTNSYNYKFYAIDKYELKSIPTEIEVGN